MTWARKRDRVFISSLCFFFCLLLKNFYMPRHSIVDRFPPWMVIFISWNICFDVFHLTLVAYVKGNAEANVRRTKWIGEKNWRKKLKYHMEWTILHSWIARRVSECDATKRKIRFDLIHVKRWRKEGWIECTVQPCIVFGLASAWHFMHTHTLTHAHSINQLIHPPRARARSPSCLSTCQTTKMYYPFFLPIFELYSNRGHIGKRKHKTPFLHIHV